MLKKHNTTLTDQGKRSKCTFPGCEETFYHKSRMISHLNTFHGTKTNVRNLVFEDEQMFMEWKEKEELDKHIYFSKQRGDGDSKLTKYAYYVCQHDGDGRSHRKEGEPARKTEKKFKPGQIKTGRFCPARLTCHMDKVNKEIRVEYITSHSHAVNLENTVFQPIPSTIRQEIKAKLSIGIPVNEVYKDLLDGMGNRNTRENDSKITRAHLVSKSNVTDIKRHMKYGRRLHPDDSTSTHLLVKKLEMENYNCIIVYKPQGQSVAIGPKMYDDIDIKKDLFAIGIQTREQLEMFIKGANKVHCIDGTHSTNKYEFPLTTVIVPDEFNKGYPVGWLISNRNDELTLRPFLEEIKSRCPDDFTVNCLMTDDDNSGWNAFSAVFGETKHLLCKWHITRAWRRNLKLVPESQQDEVMQHLLVILNEKDASQFKILQRGFLKKCSVIAPAFAKYFQDRYVRRAEKWAMCYRQFEHCNTDTNMFVESFHNKLKTFFMERRPNKRIDDLINLLLTIEEEDYWRKKRSLTYYGNLKNISIEDSRHTKGLNISDAKVEKLSESEWTVQSQSRDGCQYNVRMLENKCTDNDCLDR
ncbi:uncharacterized protein LOC130635887 [Hydractinia symbiolongicarpus]|uniref:uncharacterized protein LOC130635887 n=1 Tax=Hydractinia symbiolongicarpus TaxID=13093 RepID=UPI00254A55C4|nr:uncharacterized protein LOC130635887 [Hydractinia symbiolongicarpus]